MKPRSVRAWKNDRHGKQTVFDGWTTRELGVCWTVGNVLNIAAVIQKTKEEAMARYDDPYDNKKRIMNVRITIEEIINPRAKVRKRK